MAIQQAVTLEDVQRAMPTKKGAITQEAVDIINMSMSEAEFQGESLIQTATTYEAVLSRNKASIVEYLNAIRFCAYLMSEEDNFTEAYKKVFYAREFVKERANLDSSDVRYRELTSAASRYRRSKLVVDILTLSQVPFELIFTGARYKAIDVLATVMTTARYDRDKINAAKELLAATKGPENMKIELDVGVKESSAVRQLNDQLAQFASSSLVHLEAGTTDTGKLGAMKVKDSDEIMDAELDDE